MTRTRDLPVFPLSPDPVRSGVSPDVAPVHVEIDAVGDENGPRIALVTLGCDKNTVDSERMMAALVGHGARVSSNVSDAEVVIVNTCGFIQSAKEQSIETILEACELKEAGELKAVVAVGCLIQRHGEELEREIPEVDLFMGLTELPGLVPELRTRGLLPAEDDFVPVMERPLRILATETPHTSFLKVSEGCDHTCAFCAIPLMRGLHRSHPVEELVREAAGLGAAGVKELNIISQDTTWYGRDLRRHDRSAPLLPDLLRALLDGTEVPWYRLFYMYPSGMTRDLVDLIASEKRILPYLDMPLQHGSDRILELMRRPERQETIRERVGWLRDAVPDLTLRLPR
jgi:ribosomal protein S12 methylthiotransferase